MTETPVFELVVDKKKFSETIGIVCRFTDTTKKVVELYMEDDQLAFSFGVGLALLDCQGSFDGKVKITHRDLKKKLVGIHFDEPGDMVVSFDKETVRFDRFSVPCRMGARVKQLNSPYNKPEEPLTVTNKEYKWAAPAIGECALNTLDEIESKIPVSLIATESSCLFCCRPEDTVTDVVQNDQSKDFDFLPVRGSNGFVGLFERNKEPSKKRIDEVMRPLEEELLFSANASMLCYLENADACPFVFLVDEAGINGAVTLSDIQKVAARPPVFLRLTLFEMLVTNWLRKNSGNGEWLNHISSKSKKSIESLYAKQIKNNESIDQLSAASLKPKLDAAFEMGAFPADANLKQDLESIRNFRNRTAHPDEFGSNEVSAKDIPRNLRILKKLIEQLNSA